MNGNRPNTLMPRDSITYWIERGRPVHADVHRRRHVPLFTTPVGNSGNTPLANNANNRYLAASPVLV